MQINKDFIITMLEDMKEEVCDNEAKCEMMDEVIKKVDNKDLCYIKKHKDINLLRPSLSSAFFIKFVDITHVDRKGRETPIIVKSLTIVDDVVTIVNINNEKIVLNERDLIVKIKKDIPFSTFLMMIN